jgi:putative pyruvate formate lyase activating enzyme
MFREALDAYKECRLCPRVCGVDRTGGSSNSRSGFCRESDRLHVSYIGPHFGEEPPLSGEKGSGTVFFTGCSLRCSYCQNYQISHRGMGEILSTEWVLKKIKEMIREEGVHNINFVSPDHFFPHVFGLVSSLREDRFDLPVVFNLSGYQALGILDLAKAYVDIYLPDFKYSDARLASRLSKCADYPGVALDAIGKMIAQKGFLDTCPAEGGLAGKGVLVRHLILPGHEENSVQALTSLYLEFGRSLPLSLMSQYTPVLPQKEEPLNRSLLRKEFERVYLHAMALGFEQIFVQFPEGSGQAGSTSPFVPDFREKSPFKA